jgi:hypothetical protein
MLGFIAQSDDLDKALESDLLSLTSLTKKGEAAIDLHMATESSLHRTISTLISCIGLLSSKVNALQDRVNQLEND